MTLIEPKHHFIHPRPWINTYTFSLMHQRLAPQTADGKDRPTLASCGGDCWSKTQKFDRLRALQYSHSNKHLSRELLG